MKPLFLITLVLVSQISEARSLKRLDVRAQLVVEKLQQDGDEKAATVVTVDSDGLVRGSRCDVAGEPKAAIFGEKRFVGCEDVKTVVVLSPRELQRLNRLVEAARVGATIPPDYRQSFCLAIATESVHATADNGEVFLQSATRPCGGEMVNESRAAAILIEDLQGYLGQYQDSEKE